MSSSGEKKSRPKKGRFAGLACLGKLLWYTTFTLFLILLAVGVAGYVIVNHYCKGLPDVSKLNQYDPSETTCLYSADGQVIATLFKENRTWVTLDKISPNMRNAILAIEDSRFYEHNGVDPVGVVRAAVDLYRSHGEIHQGASTITMQLARAFFLNDDPSFQRKIREALLALQIEKSFTKDEILELYLNHVYLGSGAYGVQAAASTYFNTKASDLTIVQSAIIAGLPASPSYYSPLVDENAAKNRALEVLGRMRHLEMIDQKQYRDAIEQLRKGMKYANKGRTEFQILKVPYFTTYVLKELTSRYSEDMLYRGGLKIYTTVDLSLQKKAEEIVASNIANYKYWYNASNAAAVVIENKTGYIRAMVGGTGWSKNNQFNRAWQARRQPGSSFKVFVYTTAVESGFSPDTIISDNAITYKVSDTETWSPKNSDGRFLGNIPMRTALMQSRNVAAVRLLTMVGAERVIEYAYRMGIKERLEPNLSLALGSAVVSPLEMASAFTCFPNGGIKIQPNAVKIVYDKDGNIIEDNSFPRQEEVLSESTAYTMCSMLQSAVEGGTGGGAAISGRAVAGKTGTTDDHRDCWFVGFTPEYSCAVWVGNDDYTRMWSAFGGDVAAPIWRSIISYAVRNKPASSFPKPNASMVSVLMCSESKCRANAKCPSTYKEYFRASSIPGNFCPIHGSGIISTQMLESTKKDPYKDDQAKKIEERKEISVEPTPQPLDKEPNSWNEVTPDTTTENPDTVTPDLTPENIPVPNNVYEPPADLNPAPAPDSVPIEPAPLPNDLPADIPPAPVDTPSDPAPAADANPETIQ
ncbi:PBP1A family penicillin-binding protein [bacterium]|nr:PBP1A family penicillin-binding protein [bacterium]